MPDKDFSSVTEATGQKVSQEQLERAYSRYALAAELGLQKDVLEVACGAGFGFGLIAATARRVIGGDYTFDLVRLARQTYQERIPLLQFDGQYLPFGSARFDIVLLYEAIYYLPQADRFVREAHRVLRPGGKVVIVTVNREWSEFNPSPFSVRYYSEAELGQLLRSSGFEAEIQAGFPAEARSFGQRVKGFLKRAATKMHLIPKTMKGKEMLKRIFFGKLKNLSGELRPGDAVYQRPQPISSSSAFKVLYAIGRKS